MQGLGRRGERGWLKDRGEGEGVGLGVAGDSEICCSRNGPGDGREEGKH